MQLRDYPRKTTSQKKKEKLIKEKASCQTAGRFFIGKGGVVVKLTPRQNLFCLEYAASGNATEAYRKAGYKVNTEGATRVNAARLLTKANIQERLREIAQEVATPKIANIQEIQEFLTKVMRQEQLEEEIVVVGSSDWREAEIKEKKPAVSTAIKAAETLAKIQGAFKTDVNITGALPVIISGEDEIAD